LLICTARPELVDSRPSWGGAARNISSLWLERLSAEDSVRMLDELLATPLPQALRDLVVERADGNPFFVEELIGTLIDRGVLERRNGHWHAAELPAGFAIPDSVHAVVAARMDLLAPGQKDWQLLEQRDFIRRRTASAMEGEREYAFKHALTREVAYASLPKSRRAQLHARFGEWLEQSGGGRDEHAPLLAHHYAEAVRQEDADLAWADKPNELSRLRAKAVESLRRAGELALARYELDEAIALLTRAVELETDEAHAAELWRLLGKANALKFDGPAFWSAMERSIELSPDAAARGAAFAELAYETSQRAGMWLRAPDRTLVEDWVRKALDLSPPRSPEHVKALLAHVFWDSIRAPEAAIEASVLAEELGDATLRTVARRARSIVASSAGDYNSAAAWAERSFELLPEITDASTTSSRRSSRPTTVSTASRCWPRSKSSPAGGSSSPSSSRESSRPFERIRTRRASGMRARCSCSPSLTRTPAGTRKRGGSRTRQTRSAPRATNAS
jgi:tetratricopeptide (TPR) repeat protein